LHAKFNNEDQGVLIFCHTRAHCEIIFQNLLTGIGNILKKLLSHDFGETPIISFNSGHPASFPTIKGEDLTKLIKEGNIIRIDYNHSKCNIEYDKLVTNSVQTRSGGWYRVIVCTSTYAAGVNLYKFTHVFIIGNQGPFVKILQNRGVISKKFILYNYYR
jgi:replicative superfamily II helicase